MPRALQITAVLLASAAAAGADELRLDPRTLLQRSVSRDVCLSADGTAIELERGELFEDDGPAAGFSYQPNEEKLVPGLWIKKELLIPNPQASKATLLVGPGGALMARINGQEAALERLGKTGNYWDAFAIDPAALVPGANEIVLHGSGRVWIARDDEFALGSRTRTRHPNRSARSTDAGKTWDRDRLGSGGNVDGEYYVRLFLDHYRPRGLLTLPVVDLGNLAGRTVAPPLESPPAGAVRLEGDGRVRARTGRTATPDRTWSPWQDLGPGGGVLQTPAGRFVQVEVELATADPLKSPRLRQVVIEASPKPAGDWSQRVRLVDGHNEEIVRSSIPFDYEPFDHPRLQALRKQYRLDEVVAGAVSELEMLGRLAAWSSGQWQRGHLQEAYPPWDALEILKPHADGQPVGGFCQQYNLVFLQACESFGFAGRPVSLGPGDLGVKLGGGHEVVEIWSNDFRKWIYIDGNTAWYFVDEADRTPLSLWELRQRQLQALRGVAFRPVRVVSLADNRQAWKGLTGWPPFVELRLIPRSNFLEHKVPLPLNQGMRGWFWTGHHAWTDAEAPASPLYSQRVSQPTNWNWTLNQAHFRLEATDRPGELRVHLDTQTPGFDTFVASLDKKAPQPISSGFVWKLHAGKNRLEVRPRNILGRQGAASWVVLEYQ